MRICLSVLLGFLLSTGIAVSAVAADKPAKVAEAPERRYADGPLTPADFRAKLPDPSAPGSLPLLALTYAGIRYNTEYRWEENRPGVIVGRITKVTVWSVVDREKSWNRRIGDLRLLDHEQGHFDIAELDARRAQEKMTGLIDARRLVARGREGASSGRIWSGKWTAQMQEVFDANLKAQIEYDRVTDHGRALIAQAEQRRIQRDALKGGK